MGDEITTLYEILPINIAFKKIIEILRNICVYFVPSFKYILLCDVSSAYPNLHSLHVIATVNFLYIFENGSRRLLGDVKYNIYFTRNTLGIDFASVSD